MKKLLPLFLLPLIGSAADRSPSDYLHIESIDQQSHEIKVINVGMKAINGYTVQNDVPGSEWRGWVGSALMFEPPLQPGAFDTYRVWPELTKLEHIRVVAVIFADGTHIGHAHDILCGMDAVTCIFETRRGWSDGYKELVRRMAVLADASPQALANLVPPTPNPVPLSKELARRTVHDRAMQDAERIGAMIVESKLTDIRAGKLSVTSVQQDLMERWQKVAEGYAESAKDNGEVTQW